MVVTNNIKDRNEAFLGKLGTSAEDYVLLMYGERDTGRVFTGVYSVLGLLGDTSLSDVFGESLESRVVETTRVIDDTGIVYTTKSVDDTEVNDTTGVIHTTLAEPKDFRRALTGPIKWDFVVLDENLMFRHVGRGSNGAEYQVLGHDMNTVQPYSDLVLLADDPSMYKGSIAPFDSVIGIPNGEAARGELRSEFESRYQEKARTYVVNNFDLVQDAIDMGKTVTWEGVVLNELPYEIALAINNETPTRNETAFDLIDEKAPVRDNVNS